MQLIAFSKQFKKYTPTELVDLARKFGLDGWDLAVRPGYPVNPDNARTELPAVAKLMKSNGLSIPMVTGNFDLLTPDHPTAEPIMAAMDQADIRCLKLGYFKYDPMKDDYWKQVDHVRHALASWQPLARRHNVRVCYHTHSERCMGLNCSAMAHLLRGMDPACIGAYLDPGHLRADGEEFAMGVAMLRDYLRLIALKDVLITREEINGHGKGKPVWLPAGQGMVNWTAVFSDLVRVGFDGAMTVHCEYIEMEDPQFLAKAEKEIRFFRAQRRSIGQAMPTDWTAERELTVPQAAALIASQFPQLAPVHAESFGAGWDNTALLINREYVFRFPRRQFAVPFIESECRILPKIALLLPLPIPSPQFIGHPCEAFSWPFAGYRVIAGHTACCAGLTESQRAAMAEPLAGFLRSLHAIRRGSPAAEGATGDTIGRLDVTKRTAMALRRLEQARSHGLVDDPAPLLDAIHGAPRGYVPRDDTLVHGDLYCLHLLVDDRGELAGVIDWGDAHLGDPAIDLAIAFSFLPPDRRAAFFKVHGGPDERTLRMARFRAAFHSLTLLEYARDSGDGDLLREARLAITYLSHT